MGANFACDGLLGKSSDEPSTWCSAVTSRSLVPDMLVLRCSQHGGKPKILPAAFLGRHDSWMVAAAQKKKTSCLCPWIIFAAGHNSVC
jgi:hypothetical protein